MAFSSSSRTSSCPAIWRRTSKTSSNPCGRRCGGGWGPEFEAMRRSADLGSALSGLETRRGAPTLAMNCQAIQISPLRGGNSRSELRQRPRIVRPRPAFGPQRLRVLRHRPRELPYGHLELRHAPRELRNAIPLGRVAPSELPHRPRELRQREAELRHAPRGWRYAIRGRRDAIRGGCMAIREGGVAEVERRGRGAVGRVARSPGPVSVRCACVGETAGRGARAGG